VAKAVKLGRAWGYGRASTEDQHDTEHVQKGMVELHISTVLVPRGYLYAGFVFDRGVSGGVPLSRRPQGGKLVSQLEAGDVVVVSKLDRGFRGILDFESTLQDWERKGVGLVMLDLQIDTTTAAGRMMGQVLASAAEFERRRKSERMREMYARRKRDGVPIPGRHVHYGFKRVKRPDLPKGRRSAYEPDPVVRAIGKRCVELHRAGLSYPAIAREMQRQGIVNAQGGKFSEWAAARYVFFEKRAQLIESLGLPFYPHCPDPPGMEPGSYETMRGINKGKRGLPGGPKRAG
jgi:DNA invertase Pin-like site-specific DNA recombinase